MTQERLNDLAEQMEEKAAAIEAGIYDDGIPADKYMRAAWAFDCRNAAYALRNNELHVVRGTDEPWARSIVEEIEACTDIAEEETKELHEVAQ